MSEISLFFFDNGTPLDVVACILDARLLRRILIRRRKDGFYQFLHETYFFEAPEDEGCVEGGWRVDTGSGTYQTALLAENDARATFRWLKEHFGAEGAANNKFTPGGATEGIGE